MIHGTMPSQISAQFDAVGTAVKEKKNTWHKSGKESSKRETELHTAKNKKKEIDVGSDTSSWKFEKEKMKRTKQGASLKRCNATLMLARIKVMRQN